ncbi:MAG TPA: DNA polymerase I [bacterium]|nr:DNA polymerase I [bacterium]
MTKDKLLLIDTFGLIYRFYHTMPKMKTAEGIPTGAVFGMARALLKIFKDNKPDYLVVAMESETPTFRHAEYAAYKAHRDRMPDELREQIPAINELISAFGITPAKLDGYEADDVIGTLARAGAEHGLEVEILTGDRDMFQLVDDSVSVLMSLKGSSELEKFDREAVKEKMGVYPERIPDLKGLEGDSSDNIPGVPGVGPKTATALLEQFGNLDAVFDSLEQIDKKGLREKLAANRELAELSRRLGTIEKNAPLPFEIGAYKLPAVDNEKLAAFFEKYEMRSFISELGMKEEAAAPPRPAAVQFDSVYKAVFDEAEIREALERAAARGRLCVDLETDGLDPFADPIVGIALASEAGDAIYIPIRHGSTVKRGGGDLFGGGDGSDDEDDSDPDAGKQLDPDRAIALLKPYLENPDIEKIGHNLKFDAQMLRAAGVSLANIAYDSFIAAYLIDPDGRRYGLKTVAANLLGAGLKTYEDMVGKGKSQKKFSEVKIRDAVDYACADVDAALRIEPELSRRLAADGLDRVFGKIEMPLIPVLAEMEWNGVALDASALAGMSEDFAARERALSAAVAELSGADVNLNSPKQVAELLFVKLGLRKVKKESTDIAVLEQLKCDHPAVPLIIKFRQASKLRGTYIDALPALINPRTGRVHTSFNQTLAASGRLSSSNPNMQNIPVRSEEGREIRRAFIPGSKGLALVSADYSQIEIRLLAEMSGDPSLLEAFRNREDIHASVAAQVFGVPVAEVTQDQRRYAKTINFGLIYGMREFRLSQELGISRQQAADFIETYFSRFPGVRDFIEKTNEKLLEDGFAETLFGRRRRVPELRSSNRQEREAGLRAAFNTRIQGSAADIMKLAMIDVHKMILAGEMDALMLLQVHDEIVLETPAEKVADTAEKTRRAMEAAGRDWGALSVELPADVKAGPNWLDMETVYTCY